jgi:hypothetical protein
MPNWCRNFLRAAGPKEDLARFLKQASPAEPSHGTKTASPPEMLSFQRLVPLPPSGGNTTDGERSGPQEEWGCRGDAIDSEFEETRDGAALYQFATAWNPPVTFLRKVSELWPTLDFILDYDEPMIDFRGTARAQAGRLMHFHLEL